MVSLLLVSIGLCMTAGAVIDTGSICAVRAARDLSAGKPAIATGSMVAMACAAIVAYTAMRWGWQLRTAPWSYPTLLTFAGAGIFALGALLNGACAIGTIGRLARGDIGYGATLIGGVIVGLILPRTMIESRMPDLKITTGLIWLSIILALSLIAIIVSRRHLSASSLIPYAILGIVAALLADVQGDWTWLSLVQQFKSGLPIKYTTIICLGAMLIGASLTAILKHRFHLIPIDPKKVLREATGGGLMAAGAILIPGGNDALLVSGVPSGSPLAITGYAVMFALLVVALRLSPLLKRWADWD
jgi:energy-converting hydrogenase Eha subunit A